MRATPLALLIMASLDSAVEAQSIGREAVTAARTMMSRSRYLQQLPDMPLLVSQTGATQRFMLFGEPASPTYRDTNFDGIDDEQSEWLLDIATRFAPIMRRNNFSAPRNFQLAAGDTLRLTRHVWREGRVVNSDALLLGAPGGPASRTKASGSEELVAAASDSALLSLLQVYAPRNGEVRFKSAEADSNVVLFIDFPGVNEQTWRRAHRDKRDIATYVHPFIDELPGDEEARYALVLQYWFFYPFNDGANNHEGDWEHVNVVLTLDSLRVQREPEKARLTESQMRSLVTNRRPAALLDIAAVEYYFHETFTVLNYLSAYNDTVRTSGLRHLQIWSEPNYIERVIRARTRAAALATHPLVYIGGNNRGPDEFGKFWPRFGAAYNRNSHGSYPLPGTWQSVGPLLATEKLSGRDVPQLTEALGDSLVFTDPNFMLFRRRDIVIVPDWERVQFLIEEEPQARMEWAWLILPIRWGFPASASPGAELVEHTDFGQVSPEGPARQPTWNRLGSRTGWREFDTQVLRVLMVPTTPWVHVKNGWGVLNVPLAFLGLMPGWGVALTQAVPWITGALNLVGSPPARTYYPGAPPFRFSSFGAGLSYSMGGERYARLVPEDSTSTARQRALKTGSGRVGSLDAQLPRLQMNVFYGRRISVENTLAFGDALLSDDDNARATLAIRELTGGFRLNGWTTNDDVLQFYTRAGYGFTWYKLTNVSFDGIPYVKEHKGGYPTTLYPSSRWWPNTWYLGTGLELFTPKKLWLVDRVGLGARVDVNTSWHALDARRPGARNLGWVRRNEVAFSLLTAW